MNKKQSIGKLGEDIACDFIKRKRYKILERNHRQKWGELDIISLAPDKTLVFIEVKALHILEGDKEDGLTPEEHLTRAKLIKLQRTARVYANNNSQLYSEDRGWRIDLIAIDLKDGKLFGEIRHYENI